MTILTRKVTLVPFPNPYVTDGLLAMWDGISNAGWDTHDSSARVWTDLVGGLVLRLSDASNYPVFDDKSFIMRGDRYSRLRVVSEKLRKIRHVELVCTNRNSNVFLQTRHNHKYIGFQIQCSPPAATVLSPSPNTAFVKSSYISFGYADNAAKVYAAGRYFQTLPADANFYNSDAFTLGAYYASGWTDSYGLGNVYAIRFYSRPLTPTEVAANYAVDHARFGL